MKSNGFLIILSILLSFAGFGQTTELLPQIGLSLISQVNQGNSYITFPTDIGNIERLWFEGNVNPNFYLRKSKNSRLMGVLTPQIIVRMYQEESFPVRTPSYRPQITMYYMLNEKPDSKSASIYGRIAHHSNGQEGDFFLDDGSLNVKSGSFTTNFSELGLIKTNVNTHFNAYQFFKTSFEVHPKVSIQEELIGVYSRYRWHNAFSIFRVTSGNNQNNSQRPAYSIKGETTWMFGAFNQLEAFSTERLNLSLTFYYHPNFLEDIGLFVQYYHGSDYYNMYFNHRLNMLRFGFMTEKLRF
ncbi:MAG: hypothetical protein ACERKD_01785 [Prolixibacteraceae bacterium]